MVWCILDLIMNTKVYKKKGKLIIEVPLKTKRSNPYDEDYGPEMDNIIGLIQSDMEMGLCFRIDMEYKGKPDQWTDYFYKYNGDIEEFEALCTKLKIDIAYNLKED